MGEVGQDVVAAPLKDSAEGGELVEPSPAGTAARKLSITAPASPSASGSPPPTPATPDYQRDLEYIKQLIAELPH